MNTALSIGRVAFSIFGHEIYWYAIVLAAAILTAILFGMYLAKKRGMNEDIIIDLCFVIFIPGIIGARILYVITHWFQYEQHPITMLYIWEGGLMILGGFILAIPAVVIYCKKKKINVWALLDILVPCIALAQCIGRWGNFFNQELYGIAVNNSFFEFFPVSVYIDKTKSWHLAIFFYESVLNLVNCCVLLRLLKRKKTHGEAFFIYLAVYGGIRFILEFLKMEGSIANMILSAIMLVGGIAGFFFKRKAFFDGKIEDEVHEKIAAVLMDSVDNGVEDVPAGIAGEDVPEDNNEEIPVSEAAEEEIPEDKADEEDVTPVDDTAYDDDDDDDNGLDEEYEIDDDDDE
ncbi:MAG: prolipoprotein diacylglyceryl transferase, partial [Clostridiales bacterium]|nr:prolipoprotein diacylglyceryl transferase [Clostridiales bacterium]